MKWLDPRDAYTLYSQQVADPVQFDSFRRWVTEGRVLSRKRGGRNEISSASALALGRMEARSLENLLTDAMADALRLGPAEPALLVARTMLEDEGAEQEQDNHVIAFHADAEDLRDALVEATYDDDASSDLEFSWCRRAYRRVTRRSLMVCAPVSLLNSRAVRRLTEAVETVLMQRFCDDMVRRGALDYGRSSPQAGVTYRVLREPPVLRAVG